jgi:hypothetical protein
MALSGFSANYSDSDGDAILTKPKAAAQPVDGDCFFTLDSDYNAEFQHTSFFIGLQFSIFIYGYAL